MDIEVDDSVEVDELVTLYDAVGWSAYTDAPDILARAVANSTIVVTARDDAGTLQGLARGLSDDATVFYLQDILVHPRCQRSGVGRRLLAVCLQWYGHVRQKVLLTDAEPAQHAFYERLGYVRSTEVSTGPLHAYVRFDA